MHTNIIVKLEKICLVLWDNLGAVEHENRVRRVKLFVNKITEVDVELRRVVSNVLVGKRVANNNGPDFQVIHFSANYEWKL